MNMESLVDWYIFNEIMKNDDTLFNSSIYLWFDNSEKKLNMGPVWDYDLAMGGIDRNDGKNVDPEGFLFTEDYWGRGDVNWFRVLLRFPDFNDMVSARWTELYSSGVFEYIKAYIKTAKDEIYNAQKVNSRRWGTTGVFVKSDSYSKSVQNLSDFVSNRIEWLNSQWNPAAITPEPVTPPPTREPVTPTPEITEAPVTEEPEITPSPEPTEAPAPTAGRSAEKDPYGTLKYVLLFVGTLAGTVLVILVAYMIIEKLKKER